jgi:hypothetical protein
MNITYYIKYVYGTPTAYLVDETFQKILRAFNGHKSLTETDKKAFELLGYTFIQVLPK